MTKHAPAPAQSHPPHHQRRSKCTPRARDRFVRTLALGPSSDQPPSAHTTAGARRRGRARRIRVGRGQAGCSGPDFRMTEAGRRRGAARSRCTRALGGTWTRTEGCTLCTAGRGSGRSKGAGAPGGVSDGAALARRDPALDGPGPSTRSRRRSAAAFGLRNALGPMAQNI